MSILNSILKTFVGDKTKKDLANIKPLVSQINQLQAQLETLSADALRAKTEALKQGIQDNRKAEDEQIQNLKEQLAQQKDIDARESLYQEIDGLEEQAYQSTKDYLDQILPEAFAIMKETARRFATQSQITVTATAMDRTLSQDKEYVKLQGDQAHWANSWDAAGKEVTWDMIHYDVQLIGGVVLHQGKIAEMQTGEGKTLVATLPVFLNALTGKGVHLVTVNDYLAKRDSAWMAPLFEFHGLRIDCIDKHQPNSPQRRNAYLADITYGTNNEFGFDYLRDNMAHTPEDLVQIKHHYAIVDEVDSVLVDDARTPLIISGPSPEGDRHEFDQLKPKVSSLVEYQRKLLTGVLAEAKKNIQEGNTQEGGIQLLRVYRGLPKNKALIKFLSEEGIKQLLQKTENHYMQDNNREMHVIDQELFFVIDEKTNQIELTEKGIESLSGDKEDKNFFVLPDIGAALHKLKANSWSPKKRLKKKKHSLVILISKENAYTPSINCSKPTPSSKKTWSM